jgi:polyphosphate kinase 2 (PPK2 family)
MPRAQRRTDAAPDIRRRRLDPETQEDMLLEREALDIDTDETRHARGEGADRADDPEIKAAGKDAEAMKLKQTRKETGERKLPKDLEGPLTKLKTADYLQLIMPLHVELLKMQNWVKDQAKKILVINEGRDAAGKGGTIKRFVEHMNPRGCRVEALDKPSDRERTEWYFQRYMAHLPCGGEIVLLDRSWYNRAMVQRVMGFCSGEEVK